MPTRAVRVKHGRVILVRPLANGDVETAMAVFERLRALAPDALQRPQAAAFPAELEHLAAVDATRHVLVAYLEGDDRPAGSPASYARAPARRSRSRWPTSTSGSASARRSTAELLADARAAGITEITALVASDNAAAVSLLRPVLDRLEVRYEGSGARYSPHPRAMSARQPPASFTR